MPRRHPTPSSHTSRRWCLVITCHVRTPAFDHVYSFSSGALAKYWTEVIVPSEVIGEILLDMVFSLFGKVDMQLPFLPIIAATDASTEYGHGGVVARASVDDVRRIARKACKSGGHVCFDEGPELPDDLLARLGPRHDLQLTLSDFDVVFSVRVETPSHINIEEANALLRYLRWVLRAKSRFAHRIVLLVDSKVVLGAISKGRSSSKPLNALVRRAAALCFAGGIILHCVFVSTKHNPSDWPSRGDAATWPTALRRRSYRNPLQVKCPGCGFMPIDHPKHLPTRLRGQVGTIHNCCIGPRGGFAFNFDLQVWESYGLLYARRLNAGTVPDL